MRSGLQLTDLGHLSGCGPNTVTVSIADNSRAFISDHFSAVVSLFKKVTKYWLEGSLK